MNRVDNIIIGFGKAGKTLANYLGDKGEKTILVEKSSEMCGGGYINVGCFPSKFLAGRAYKKPDVEIKDEEYYKISVENKDKLIEELNQETYDDVINSNVEVVFGLASFKDEHTINIKTDKGEFNVYTDRIFINTGAYPFVPTIEGLKIENRIHTSETLMDLEAHPKTLTILGGGIIGLEFAATYAKFGSKVTVIDKASRLLPKEDADVAEEVFKSYKDLGVNFVFDAEVSSVYQDDNTVKVSYSSKGENDEIISEAFLVATGRKPNIEDLKLENAGIESSERGFINVNEHLQTSKPNIFAIGDVNGGPQFTYVSLDDYRIVRSYLEDNGKYSRKNRQPMANAAFLHPTFSKVGLTETEAIDAGYNIKVAKLSASEIIRAKILGNTAGIYKAVVNADTKEILGVVLFGEDSHEVINLVVMAMIMKQPYTMLANHMFTHPSMAEALNDLFSML